MRHHPSDPLKKFGKTLFFIEGGCNDVYGLHAAPKMIFLRVLDNIKQIVSSRVPLTKCMVVDYPPSPFEKSIAFEDLVPN